MDLENSVLAFIELSGDNEIMPISLEAIGMGREIANAFDTQLVALVLGSDINSTSQELRHFGLDTIYVVDNPFLKEYQPEYYAAAFEKAYQEIQAKVIIMGNTLAAIDMAPRLALRLNTGLVTDCVRVEIESGEMHCTKPVYSSNVMAIYSFAAEPHMVTMRARAVDPIERRDEAKGEVVAVNVALDESITRISLVKQVPEEEEGGPKLENADIIVSGGRGIGGPEGFEEISALAQVLGGVVGASRPPCDLGWISPKAQVGVTGKIVAPSLYIAVGISGSTQHLAGMSESKVIIAINEKREANIFKYADYGVVGDFSEVVPSFTKELSQLRS